MMSLLSQGSQSLALGYNPPPLPGLHTLNPKIIKTPAQPQAALARIEKIFDAKPCTPKEEEL